MLSDLYLEVTIVTAHLQSIKHYSAFSFNQAARPLDLLKFRGGYSRQEDKPSHS